MKIEELKIKGMTCNHCVMAVKKELEKLNAIIVEKVDLGYAKVQYDDTKISHDDLRKAIDDAGYSLQN